MHPRPERRMPQELQFSARSKIDTNALERPSPLKAFPWPAFPSSGADGGEKSPTMMHANQQAFNMFYSIPLYLPWVYRGDRFHRRPEMTEIELDAIKDGDHPEAPIRVTEANFEDFRTRFGVALLDFWAPWCGPCKMMTPVLEEISKELKGKVAIGKLNTDENPAVAMKYRIQAIPTLIIFKDGELVDQVVGVMPKKKLVAKLEEHF